MRQRLGGQARCGCGRGEGREHCTVPDQLVVDKELEFRVKVGETDTEGGPVAGREHREEIMDGRTESTENTQTQAWKHTV